MFKQVFRNRNYQQSKTNIALHNTQLISIFSIFLNTFIIVLNFNYYDTDLLIQNFS